MNKILLDFFIEMAKENYKVSEHNITNPISTINEIRRYVYDNGNKLTQSYQQLSREIQYKKVGVHDVSPIIQYMTQCLEGLGQPAFKYKTTLDAIFEILNQEVARANSLEYEKYGLNNTIEQNKKEIARLTNLVTQNQQEKVTYLEQARKQIESHYYNTLDSLRKEVEQTKQEADRQITEKQRQLDKIVNEQALHVERAQHEAKLQKVHAGYEVRRATDLAERVKEDSVLEWRLKYSNLEGERDALTKELGSVKEDVGSLRSENGALKAQVEWLNNQLKALKSSEQFRLKGIGSEYDPKIQEQAREEARATVKHARKQFKHNLDRVDFEAAEKNLYDWVENFLDKNVMMDLDEPAKLLLELIEERLRIYRGPFYESFKRETTKDDGHSSWYQQALENSLEIDVDPDEVEAWIKQRAFRYYMEERSPDEIVSEPMEGSHRHWTGNSEEKKLT